MNERLPDDNPENSPENIQQIAKHNLSMLSDQNQLIRNMHVSSSDLTATMYAIIDSQTGEIQALAESVHYPSIPADNAVIGLQYKLYRNPFQIQEEPLIASASKAEIFTQSEQALSEMAQRALEETMKKLNNEIIKHH